MAWLIGTDEAGYGPKLGPLVIVMTAWEVPDSLLDIDLYELLGAVVCRVVSGGSGRPGPRRVSRVDEAESGPRPLRIADSKQLYQAGGTLSGIELGTLVALKLLGHSPTDWRSLIAATAPEDADAMTDEPWYGRFGGAVPVDVSAEAIDTQAARLSQACVQAGIRLSAVRARVIRPAEFNRRVARCGSKGEVLSELTLELVRWACAAAGEQPCRVVCDKHGGRNHYGGLLQATLTDSWVHVLTEGRDRSVYRWGSSHQIEFRVAGEHHLPSGLASMVAKYLREQSMRAWNAHWLSQCPGLRPTAGYPVDAARFLAEIRSLLGAADLSLDQIWRDR